jgi:hypothetical protein
MPSSSITPPPHHNTSNRVEANASIDAMDIDVEELTWMEHEEEEQLCTKEAKKYSEEHARRIAEAKPQRE